MKFELTTFDAFRFGSFLFNLFIFGRWLKRRVVLDEFLEGQWVGILEPSDSHNDVFHCELYLAGHSGSDNTGSLLYHKEDLETKRLLVWGVDSIVSYPSNPLFIVRRTWHPRFIRTFHHNTHDDEPLRTQATRYQWNCKIKSIFFSPKMHVCVQVLEDGQEGSLGGKPLEFSGTLRKA